MSLFRHTENLSEDENQTEAQIHKKKMRIKMNRSEDDPVFKGKFQFFDQIEFLFITIFFIKP